MTDQPKPPAGMANTVDVIARAQARRDALPQAGPGYYGPHDPLPDDGGLLDGLGAHDSDDQEDFRGRTALWEAYILAGGDPTIAGDPQRDVAGMHLGMLTEATLGAVRAMRLRHDQLANGALAPTAAAPIPMVLLCPECGEQHVDAPEPSTGWTNPPHRSHLCAACGAVWRPADVPTVGVARLQTKGQADTWLPMPTMADAIEAAAATGTPVVPISEGSQPAPAPKPKRVRPSRAKAKA